MNKYCIPIYQDGEYIIYMKRNYPTKIGIDSFEYYKNLYIRMKVKKLKDIFKDNDKVIKDIEKEIYPPFKVDKNTGSINIDNFLMNDEDQKIIKLLNIE